MDSIRTLLALSLMATTATFARGWTVSQTDTLGANFSSLQAAIDSASVGDTLWLDHGAYGSGGNEIRLDKRMVLMGRQAEKRTVGIREVGVDLILGSGASGSVLWGIDGIIGTTGNVNSVEIGYARLSGLGDFQYSRIHHSNLIINYSYGMPNGSSNTRFENCLFGVFGGNSIDPTFRQNVFENISADGLGGSDNLVSNSVLGYPTGAYSSVNLECHYRNVLFTQTNTLGLANTASHVVFADSLHGASPFSAGYHVASPWNTIGENGYEPGVFGGAHPLKLLGNEEDLIPALPIPWLRLVSAKAIKVAPTDSLELYIEAERGK